MDLVDKPSRSTAAKLVDAAMGEFNERGFGGTDTNRIARRAGFAPQTFYRWFKDKTEIFIAAYRAWEDAERSDLQRLAAEAASSQAVAAAIIAHHRQYKGFRRSLRQLSLEDPQMRRARAESRLRQIDQVRAWSGRSKAKADEIVVALLEVERLSDAVAEGELGDMRLSDELAQVEIARLIHYLRGSQS